MLFHHIVIFCTLLDTMCMQGSHSSACTTSINQEELYRNITLKQKSKSKVKFGFLYCHPRD